MLPPECKHPKVSSDILMAKRGIGRIGMCRRRRAQGGNQKCLGVGIPGQSNGPRKGMAVCVPKGETYPIYPPAFSPSPGRTPRAVGATELLHSQHLWGRGQAAGNTAPAAQEAGGAELQRPRGAHQLCAQTAVPLSNSVAPRRRKRRRSPQPLRIVTPGFTCLVGRWPPQAAARRPTPEAPHLQGSRRRRRTRSCKPGPRSGVLESWA